MMLQKIEYIHNNPLKRGSAAEFAAEACYEIRAKMLKQVQHDTIGEMVGDFINC